ncbi:uncharacterized protein LOC106654747 [Trichogramma pretiosum]|uniref:uncharacterized protein LOC106654747 n=1 Tax=Trichogramma pretiosum TaxID=7493 RepID=UPI0006C9822E|nr:uncharacterized protein LOC106654747 [Trichogramma pretiosum]
MSQTEERQTLRMLIMGMTSIKHGVGRLRTAMRSVLNAPEEVGNEASENELQREERAPEQVPEEKNIATYVQAIHEFRRSSKSMSPSPTEVQEQVEPPLRAESPVGIGPLPASPESPVKPPDNLLGPASGPPKAKSDENDRSPSEEGSQACETDAQIFSNLPAIYQRRGSDNSMEGVNFPPSATIELSREPERGNNRGVEHIQWCFPEYPIFNLPLKLFVGFVAIIGVYLIIYAAILIIHHNQRRVDDDDYLDYDMEQH